jgi:hypothetical protein
MSNLLRRNRKGTDTAIVRLNAIGLSLATIAQIIDCHPTSITLRLKSLNIPAADTRRTFMEDIYSSLPAEFKENLADVLVAEDPAKPKSIKAYVRELLSKDVANRLTLPTPLERDTISDTPDAPELTNIDASGVQDAL